MAGSGRQRWCGIWTKRRRKDKRLPDRVAATFLFLQAPNAWTKEIGKIAYLLHTAVVTSGCHEARKANQSEDERSKREHN